MDHRQADVVIVGAGTAGIPAAVEAARHGAKVTVLEKSDKVGGTLWRSWAQMSAGGTLLQKSKGIQDNPQLHFDDVMRISKGTADPHLVRLAVENAPETIDWLMTKNFDMDPDAPAILHFHEPYSLPRTYWGRKGGESILEAILPEFEKLCHRGSISLELNTAFIAVQSTGNHIDSVTIRRPDGSLAEIEASTVILTSGGYSGNASLFPKLTSGAALVGPGSPASDGSGILAAVEAGGQVRGQDKFLPTYGGILQQNSTWEAVHLDDYPVLTPQARQPWEIHVNRHGVRFVAEDAASVDDRENALLGQPGLEFWIIYDERIRQEAPPLFPNWKSEDLDGAFSDHGSFSVGNDLAALAMEAGIDVAGLIRSVEQYNRSVAQGVDEFGRKHLPLPIGTGPYYAVKNHGTTIKSPAGLDVDENLRIRRGDGVFDNFFAAGEAIGGSSLSGKSFVSGMSVTPALTFGRMLGRHAAGVEVEDLKCTKEEAL